MSQQVELLNGVPVVSGDAASSGFGGGRVRSASPAQRRRSRSSHAKGGLDGAESRSSRFGISSYATVAPPLDYSFQEIKEMSELVSHEPNGKSKLPSSPTSADANPSAASSPSNAAAASSSSDSASRRPGGQLITGIRLSYNELTNLSGFDEALQAIIGPDARTQLTWLDLGFNKLTTVPDELLHYPNLRTLYLAGNQISHIDEIRKLSQLEHLQKLALQGNPIYQSRQNHGLRNPRSGIIWHLRSCPLKSLDFCTITDADRRNSMRWAEQNKPKKKRRPAEGEGADGSPTRR